MDIQHYTAGIDALVKDFATKASSLSPAQMNDAFNLLQKSFNDVVKEQRVCATDTQIRQHEEGLHGTSDQTDYPPFGRYRENFG